MSGSAGVSESYREKLEYFKKNETAKKGPKWLKEGGRWYQTKDVDVIQDSIGNEETALSKSPLSPAQTYLPAPTYPQTPTYAPTSTYPPATTYALNPTYNPDSPSDTGVPENEIAPGTVDKGKALLRAMGVGQTYLVPPKKAETKNFSPQPENRFANVSSGGTVSTVGTVSNITSTFQSPPGPPAMTKEKLRLEIEVLELKKQNLLCKRKIMEKSMAFQK